MGEPIAQNTVFGWIVSGPIGQPNVSDGHYISAHHSITFADLDKSIQRFWDSESLILKSIPSPEDELCESYFMRTHSRTDDGRYMVRLPFCLNSSPQVGQSRVIAERSLQRIETCLLKNPIHEKLYKELMHDYNSMDHMRTVEHGTPVIRQLYTFASSGI